eukprot:454057-Hanusia_phi.AAC.4
MPFPTRSNPDRTAGRHIAALGAIVHQLDDLRTTVTVAREAGAARLQHGGHPEGDRVRWAREAAVHARHCGVRLVGVEVAGDAEDVAGTVLVVARWAGVARGARKQVRHIARRTRLALGHVAAAVVARLAGGALVHQPYVLDVVPVVAEAVVHAPGQALAAGEPVGVGVGVRGAAIALVVCEVQLVPWVAPDAAGLPRTGEVPRGAGGAIGGVCVGVGVDQALEAG